MEIGILGIADKFNEPLLGIANGAAGSFELRRKDIIGLRDFYISSIYPIRFDSVHILFFVDSDWAGNEKKFCIEVETKEGEQVGKIDADINIGGEGENFSKYILEAAQIPGVINRPCTLNFFLKKEEQKHQIGIVHFLFQPAIPLTQERLEAIKSDPFAAKKLIFEIGCTSCNDKCRIVAGLEKKPTEGYIWYTDLPDLFKCTCGKVTQELKYLRQNAHVLLGYKQNPFTLPESIEKTYTHAAIEEVGRKFFKLVEEDKTTEEEVQKFIEKNPILLHIFSPVLLRYKNAVGTEYKTDFTIFNTRDELLLVEIERPNIPLFNKTGDQSAKLTHAIGQVENWLQKANRNRLGLIDDLKIPSIKIDSVKNIRGVVIAGRKKDDYDKHMEKVLGRNSQIDFYTYDDLLSSLRQTAENIKKL